MTTYPLRVVELPNPAMAPAPLSTRADPESDDHEETADHAALDHADPGIRADIETAGPDAA